MEDRERDEVALLIFIAPADVVSDLLEPFGAEVRPVNQYTADLSDAFFSGMWAMCARLKCQPSDLLGCWMNESHVRATAHNANGHASGIFQVMPAIARGLGWDPKDVDLTRYRLLTAEEQLAWAERYYAPHAGKLVNAAACYVATFLPAFLNHAGDPAYVLCSTHHLQEDYWANRDFDQDRKGKIVVGDLTMAIARACQGPRWTEIVARLAAAEPLPPTQPEAVAELPVEPTLEIDTSGVPDDPEAA